MMPGAKLHLWLHVKMHLLRVKMHLLRVKMHLLRVKMHLLRVKMHPQLHAEIFHPDIYKA